VRRNGPSSKNIVESVYCPMCWAADAKLGSRYLRRSWYQPWTPMYEIHRVSILDTTATLDRLLNGASQPRWRKANEAAFLPAIVDHMANAQSLIRRLVMQDKLSPSDHARAQVLKDLYIAAGTKFGENSFAELSRGSIHGRAVELCWRNARGQAIMHEEICKPSGSLMTRRHALRVASMLMIVIDGVRAVERHEDLVIRSMLLYLGPYTESAWVLNQARRRWSEDYRSRWAAAFAWPDSRDPVCSIPKGGVLGLSVFIGHTPLSTPGIKSI